MVSKLGGRKTLGSSPDQKPEDTQACFRGKGAEGHDRRLFFHSSNYMKLNGRRPTRVLTHMQACAPRPGEISRPRRLGAAGPGNSERSSSRGKVVVREVTGRCESLCRHQSLERDGRRRRLTGAAWALS